ADRRQRPALGDRAQRDPRAGLAARGRRPGAGRRAPRGGPGGAHRGAGRRPRVYRERPATWDRSAISASNALTMVRSRAALVDTALASLRHGHATVGLGPWRLRFRRRSAVVYLVLAVVAVVAGVAGILIGDYPISPGQVVGALLGQADDRLAQYFVV